MIIEPLDKYLTEKNRNIYNSVRAIIPEGIIAGGAARQIFLDEQFGSTDVDFYFPNLGAYDVWNSALNRLNIHRRYSNSKNAIEYLATLPNTTIKLQLICKDFGTSPQEIFNTFDITCCKFAIKDESLYYTEEALEHTRNKLLVYCGNPNDSIDPYHRIGKYLKKGYVPSCDYSLKVLQEFLQYIDNEYFFSNDFTPRKPNPGEVENNIEKIFFSFFGNVNIGDY